MQLYHFDKAPNYGDALNPWLWPQLLGPRLQPSSPTRFLGIGTLLNAEDVPQADRYAVLGSGGGYGPFPQPDARWHFYAVRGPLTARALGIDPALAMIDGAYLLRRVPLPPPATTGPRVGFMPHWQTRLRVPWEQLCGMAGLRYIRPDLTVTETLAEFRACDGVIAEAMHAAITADALGIRWLPVRLGGQFLDFKWQDWLGSVGLTCRPIPLPRIRPVVEWERQEGLCRSGYRRAVNTTAYVLQTRALVARLRGLRRQLETNSRFGHLSSRPVMEQKLGQLEQALDLVRARET